jgi:hypothetical protein
LIKSGVIIATSIKAHIPRKFGREEAVGWTDIDIGFAIEEPEIEHTISLPVEPPLEIQA